MTNRKINHRIPAIAIMICFSFCMQYTVAQTVKTFIDKNTILIGEQVQYKVQATFPAGIYNVQWFTIPDSIAHFEVVERAKPDTSTENNNTIIEQTITLTSFDSGRWKTPVLPINFDPVKDASPLNLFTDSLPVNVTYMVPDSTNELRDIKPIIEVTVADYLWYYIAGGLVLLLLIVLFLWRYFKKKKKQPAPLVVSKLSAFDEAMQSLEKLKQLNLERPEEIKQYHTGLSEIFKWYISRVENTTIMNKTSSDVLVQLSGNKLSKENIATVATALRMGDAVKFAKFLPAAFESEQCFIQIKGTIQHIQNYKPVNQ
jgi:hypothetical protein